MSDREERTKVLGVQVSSTSYEDAVCRIVRWARARESRYVCVAAVNNVMESYDVPCVQTAMNESDLLTPDGMPLVWALRLLGRSEASRVYGPDLTPRILERAEQLGIPVGFYGASASVLAGLMCVVHERYPALRVGYAASPPFRPLASSEDEEVVTEINASGVRILFVGLGTSKQDLWMAEHRGRIQAVMIGVGAAFDFLAGSKRQAPRWMMPIGLEWLFRLCTEPRRLWRRYLKQNPRFIWLLLAQLIRSR
jgi:N-acetylglucosaminyldiphosphoundecaprenol N-acetyl-beta-D-mannosaminyltransferase